MVGEWRIYANSSSVIIVDKLQVSGVKIHYYIYIIQKFGIVQYVFLYEASKDQKIKSESKIFTMLQIIFLFQINAVLLNN